MVFKEAVVVDSNHLEEVDHHHLEEDHHHLEEDHDLLEEDPDHPEDPDQQTTPSQGNQGVMILMVV